MSGSSIDPGRRPPLSAVVIALNGDPCLTQCVAALQAEQPDPAQLETIVVFDPAGRCAAAVSRLQAERPDVTWLASEPGATVPRMRTQGLLASQGEVIALLEDDCVVEPGWCAAAVAAHATPDAAVGGAVEPGPYRRALDWAVYFCEYGRFMRPLVPGPNLALALAGNHVTYKRASLALMPPNPAGFYDLFVHAAWQKAGVPMRVEETLVVRNVNSWSLRHVTSVPFHHGRAYAGQRGQGWGAGRRVAFGVLVLALPLLAIARITRQTLARRRLLPALTRALPWIGVFTVSWSLGEAVGFLRGPGNSAARWR